MRYGLAVLLLFQFQICCAIVFKGTVKDTYGNPLPYATIYLKNNHAISAAANKEGAFQLDLPLGRQELICQYIGYQVYTKTIDVTAESATELNLVLQDQQYQMKEVLIKKSKEDPAYEIMRKAIDQRAHHLKQYQSFQTDIYLKGAIKNRSTPDYEKLKAFTGNIAPSAKKKKEDSTDLASMKGILYLCEEDATYYLKRPKDFLHVRAVRESGNPNGLGVARFPAVLNFYENIININPEGNPRGFISPVSKQAMLYYKYKLIGSFSQHGHEIFKIKVIPKNDATPSFAGTIYIVDSEFAIHSIDVYLTQKQTLNVLDTLGVQQQYVEDDAGNWIVQSQMYFATLSILSFDILASFNTVYSNQKVNPALSDSLFSQRLITAYEKQATKKDTSYWSNNRPIPLVEDERRDFIKKDSIRIALSNPRYIDSMRKKYNRISSGAVLITGINYSDSNYKNTIQISPILFSTQFNTVEGLNFSPKIKWIHTIDSNAIRLSETAIRYGFSNKTYQAMTRLEWLWKDKNWYGKFLKFGLEAGQYMVQFNSESPVSIDYNTASSLSDAHNYLKLYQRGILRGYTERNFANGCNLTMSVAYHQRTFVENYSATPFTWNKDVPNQYTANTPLNELTKDLNNHDAFIIDIKANYRPGIRYIQYPDKRLPVRSNWPLFSLQYTKAIPGIGQSSMQYDKLKLSISDVVSLKMAGSFDYILHVGGFINKEQISFPDCFHILGNQYNLTPSYSNTFQLAPYYLYSHAATSFAELHLSYYLKGFLTNKIPLFNRLQWYLVTGVNALYIKEDQHYTEAFVGVDNLGWGLVRFLRIDYVQSRDAHNHVNSGIRFGLNLNALSPNVAPARKGEW
jgi:hypothetical protein